MKSPIAPDIYWALPGPRNFVSRIASATLRSRAVFVNLPSDIMPGTWEGVKKGVHDAHFNEVIDLVITGGMDIPSQVGSHFYKQTLDAHALAGVKSHDKKAVLIRASDDQSRRNCESYASSFIQSLGSSDGNVTLICSIHEEEFREDRNSEEFEIVVFDGGLSADEMEAYVIQRTIGRSKIGSTMLRRAIVSEFAGFDAAFAEQLMDLPDTSLLGVVTLLGSLAAEDRARWRKASMMTRTLSSAMPRYTHVMHEQYLLQFGSQQEKARAEKNLKRHYWRACVKTLTPWLEECRHDVVSVFKSQLEAIADPVTRKIKIPQGPNRTIDIEPAAVEYNNIVGMYRELNANHGLAYEAMGVCRLAKEVRDDIAHLRPPLPTKVNALITEMDTLLGKINKMSAEESSSTIP